MASLWHEILSDTRRFLNKLRAFKFNFRHRPRSILWLFIITNTAFTGTIEIGLTRIWFQSCFWSKLIVPSAHSTRQSWRDFHRCSSDIHVRCKSSFEPSRALLNSNDKKNVLYFLSQTLHGKRKVRVNSLVTFVSLVRTWWGGPWSLVVRPMALLWCWRKVLQNCCWSSNQAGSIVISETPWQLPLFQLWWNHISAFHIIGQLVSFQFSERSSSQWSPFTCWSNLDRLTVRFHT